MTASHSPCFMPERKKSWTMLVAAAEESSRIQMVDDMSMRELSEMGFMARGPLLLLLVSNFTVVRGRDAVFSCGTVFSGAFHGG